MDKRVTPPKRVTSPTWGPPTPCKQALRFKDATATRTSLTKRICFLSVFMAIIPTYHAYLLFQMYANPPEFEFQRDYSQVQEAKDNFVVACLRSPCHKTRKRQRNVKKSVMHV